MSRHAESSSSAVALAPSDRVTLALLAVIAAVFTVRLPAVAGSFPAWALHGSLLAGFAIAVGWARRHSTSPAAAWARAVATVAVMMTLYSSLGRPVFRIIPWRADAAMEAADRLLFAGRSPALWAAGRVGVPGLEAWSAVYGFFVPFLYLSIFLGCVGRPPREREEFLAGFAATYALAYLGYLFLPTTGPIEAVPGAATPAGGPIHRMILRSVESTGGNHGAFPSLHVGASAYLCLFDWRHSRLRGMTYLPVVLLIGFSTLFLQYHYVVDLIAGAAIAVAADRFASRAGKGGSA